MPQMKFDLDRTAGLRDIHVWKCERTDGLTDRRTPAPVPSYKLTDSLRLRWAKDTNEPAHGCYYLAEDDNDKEALFNVTHNETDNISSLANLRHNNTLNRYLPVLLNLPRTI